MDRRAFDIWEEHELFCGHLPSILEMAIPPAKADRQVPTRVMARVAARVGQRRLG